MSSEKIKVLYVDDDAKNLSALKALLDKHFEIFTASSHEDGLRVLGNENIHVVMTDQRMPSVSGVKFFELIMKKYPDPVRILFTGHADLESVIDAVNKTHIFEYISKPWKKDELIKGIEEAYKTYRSRTEPKEMVSNLQRTNEQLEFMLREKLIS